jgi:hypothetical protein
MVHRIDSGIMSPNGDFKQAENVAALCVQHLIEKSSHILD